MSDRASRPFTARCCAAQQGPTPPRTRENRNRKQKTKTERRAAFFSGVSFFYLVARRDEVLERREDGQARADGRLVQKPGAALAAARVDDLVVERLRARERLFVRRDDVDACAQQRGVRLGHRGGRGVVDEHDGVVGAHERRERACEVVAAATATAGGSGSGSGSSGGAEERAPVGRGRDAVWIEDARFGGGERDEADDGSRVRVRRLRLRERLELAHELGADEPHADDGDGDGFGRFGKQLGRGGGGHHHGAGRIEEGCDIMMGGAWLAIFVGRSDIRTSRRSMAAPSIGAWIVQGQFRNCWLNPRQANKQVRNICASTLPRFSDSISASHSIPISFWF